MQAAIGTTIDEFVLQFISTRHAKWCQWRRELHASPELSWQEVATTRFIREQLGESGLSLTAGPRGLGGFVDIDFGEPGVRKRIGVRGDIDAIPVMEANDSSYCSRVPGVMHACGHDVHCVVMLSVAETLKRVRDEGLISRPVSIRVIFQPAEETGQGAHESIASGMIDGVDAILAMHVDPTRDVGTIALRDGVQTACCDELRFVIEGTGGHGARPHETSDTILAAAHLIHSAHSLVPRIVDARDDSVLSICRIHGGNSANVIPTRVEMLGTLRSFTASTRDTILARLRTLASSTSALFNVNAEFLTTTTVPSVDNCPTLNRIVGDIWRRLSGAEAVQQAAISLGGEDFACYQKHIPGSLIRVGSASGHRFGAHLHSPHFDVDEQVIGVSCRLLVHSLLEWSLQNNPV